MEIVPVVEVELNHLESPSVILDLVSDLLRVWPSVALLVAGLAAVLGVARPIILLVVSHCKGRSVISRSISFSDVSSDGESEEDEDEEDDQDEDKDSILSSSDEYEPVSGFGNYREKRREDGVWPELSWTGPVVKTWDGFGVGFVRSGGVISLLDLDRHEALRSFPAPPSAVAAAWSLATPALLISAAAAGSDDGGTASTVAVWDARAAGEGAPAAEAEWRALRRRRVVRVAAGGNGKVYVGDEGGGVVVADLRNGRSAPLAEAWWDADAVNIVDSGVRGGLSVVTWCRNAVRSFPILPSPK